MASAPKTRVLVIDDEMDFRSLIQAKLESEGFEVTATENGEKGLQSIAKHRPEIILLDMLMPEEDGLDTYHKLRQNHKTRTIPVIFLTAMAVEGHWEQLPYDSDGPCFVMGKPYNPGLIVEKIRGLLGHIPHP